VNFLIAPDGQRLFAINCAPCHGRSVAYSGGEQELQEIISQGGLHLEMPPWQEMLSSTEIDTLANYVVDPQDVPGGSTLFVENCSSCHGERVPGMEDVEAARQVISSGGAHQTMPVWEEILTPEQMDALVSYTLEAAQGTSTEIGQQLFVDNCAVCHGEFGEGGPNPARPDDIIAPISTSEYLTTRDDFTLRTIIAQGQPNFGMSPFGSSFGGPLDDEQIDAIVAYLRSWEQNPPVELPPEVQYQQVSLDSQQIYADLCAQCHGERGEGGIGPALADPEFQAENTDEEIFETINLGHEATPMIAWGEVLSADQIQKLVELIRQMEPVDATEQPESTPAARTLSFENDILPIFEAKCNTCHGSMGGWDGRGYESALNSGDHGPAVIPGDPENSFLVQKLLGTQTTGAIMPPGGKLPDSEIQLIIDWIQAGALE
jgi:mono/diheme cytochrome c family protein